MTSGAERSLLGIAQDLLAGGRDALDPLPTVDQLSAMDPADRHALLTGLRGELYAIASIIAEGAIGRARREGSLYPPYGLVRSMFSKLRMVVDAPEPFEPGSIDGYRALGLAILDTVVFQLDRELADQRASDRNWIVGRLGQLLALFRVDAGPSGQARMRDEFSFLYGGLHFGTSVCVQMVEAMSRLLDGSVGTPAVDKAAVITRSTRPPYHLAALNIDDVPLAYRQLLADADGAPGWMGSGHFMVQAPDGTPARVDLRLDHLPATTTHGDRPNSYPTQGCPARVSPTGRSSAIAVLWAWCIELAQETKLI